MMTRKMLREGMQITQRYTRRTKYQYSWRSKTSKTTSSTTTMRSLVLDKRVIPTSEASIKLEIKCNLVRKRAKITVKMFRSTVSKSENSRLSSSKSVLRQSKKRDQTRKYLSSIWTSMTSSSSWGTRCKVNYLPAAHKRKMATPFLLVGPRVLVVWSLVIPRGFQSSMWYPTTQGRCSLHLLVVVALSHNPITSRRGSGGWPWASRKTLL